MTSVLSQSDSDVNDLTLRLGYNRGVNVKYCKAAGRTNQTINLRLRNQEKDSAEMITNLKRIIRARPSYRKPESDTDSVSSGASKPVEGKAKPIKSQIKRENSQSSQNASISTRLPVRVEPKSDTFALSAKKDTDNSEFDGGNISFSDLYGYEPQREEDFQQDEEKDFSVKHDSEETHFRRSRRHSLDGAGVSVMKITRSASSDNDDETGTLSALQFCIPQIDPLESKLEKETPRTKSFLSKSLHRSDKSSSKFLGRRHSMSYMPPQASEEPSGKNDKPQGTGEAVAKSTRPTLKRENSSFANESFRQALPMSYCVNKATVPPTEGKTETRPTLQREGSSFSTGSSFRVRARRHSLECSGYVADRSNHGTGSEAPRIGRRSLLSGISGSEYNRAPQPAVESASSGGPGLSASSSHSRGSSARGSLTRDTSFRRSLPRRASSGPIGANVFEYDSSHGVATIAASSILKREPDSLSGSSHHSRGSITRGTSFRRSMPRRASSGPNGKNLLEYGSSHGVAAVASSSILKREIESLSRSSGRSKSCVIRSSFGRSTPRRASSGPVSGSMLQAFNAVASRPASSGKLLDEVDDSSSSDDSFVFE